MSEEIWFEEELVVPAPLVEEAAKGLAATPEASLSQEKAFDIEGMRAARDKAAFARKFVQEEVKGIVRVHRPRWRPLTDEEAAPLPTGVGDIEAGRLASSRLYLVRLGAEFDIPLEGKESGWAYTVAWFRAYLFSPSPVQPRVVNLYPERLYEGGPTTVRVEVGPALKAGPVDVELASISADLHLGQVTPVMVGFFGKEERAPYWELRPKDKPLLGVYHFWLIVEQPPGCRAVRLSALAEANLQTRLFNVPVGPKVRAWNKKESVVLI